MHVDSRAVSGAFSIRTWVHFLSEPGWGEARWPPWPLGIPGYCAIDSFALATKLFNKQFSSSVFCESVIPVLYSATVLRWLELLQCYGSQFSGSQFYGAVLRLQFYGPNVRVPDTTEPRTWLIRQSASLLPPFAAVMSPSPPREMDTVLPPSYFLWSQVITKYQHLISLSCFVLRISPFPTRPVPVTPLLLLDFSRRFYYYYYHNF